ncbi:hypothetical protein WG66_010278 [Moniliophthora roreri]|nr:hypothetical protein WG66_010278 [Moniliophthora roreri]
MKFEHTSIHRSIGKIIFLSPMAHFKSLLYLSNSASTPLWTLGAAKTHPLEQLGTRGPDHYH